MDFTTVIWAVVVLGALAIVFGLILAGVHLHLKDLSLIHISEPTRP